MISLQQEISAEVKRQNHQRELRIELNKAAQERLTKNTGPIEPTKSVFL